MHCPINDASVYEVRPNETMHCPINDVSVYEVRAEVNACQFVSQTIRFMQKYSIISILLLAQLSISDRMNLTLHQGLNRITLRICEYKSTHICTIKVARYILKRWLRVNCKEGFITKWSYVWDKTKRSLMNVCGGHVSSSSFVLAADVSLFEIVDFTRKNITFSLPSKQ